MPIFGALVVVLVGCWAGSIGGQKAGVVAAWLAAIDPNLLAHSGLVTNDVACTASLLACFYFASRLIVQATFVNISLFCVACGVAACIKYTCLALPLLLAPVAVLRLFDSSQWKLPAERSANSLLSRLWLTCGYSGCGHVRVWKYQALTMISSNSEIREIDGFSGEPLVNRARKTWTRGSVEKPPNR